MHYFCLAGHGKERDREGESESGKKRLAEDSYNIYKQLLLLLQHSKCFKSGLISTDPHTGI